MRWGLSLVGWSLLGLTVLIVLAILFFGIQTDITHG